MVIYQWCGIPAVDVAVVDVNVPIPNALLLYREGSSLCGQELTARLVVLH